MRQKLLLFVLLTGLSVILLGSPPPSAANVITVDGFCTLIDAIIAANTDSATGSCPGGSVGPDTIVLDVDISLTSVYPGSTNIGGGQSGLPDITSDITIQAGSAANITGNSTDFRIFNVVSPGNLTLTGLNVRGGRIVGNGGSGGGIYVAADAALTLDTVRLYSNQIEGVQDTSTSIVNRGGALMNEGTISIIASRFDNNLAVGGQIMYQGEPVLGGVAWGGAIANNGTITSIEESVFEFNEARGRAAFETGGGAAGGAISNQGDILSINLTTFASNTAQGGDSVTYEAGFPAGGALYNGGNITLISDSTFTNNLTRSGATTGGIGQIRLIEAGTINNSGTIDTILRATITNNTVDGNECSGDCHSLIWGGGVHNSGSINLMSGVNISDNTILGTTNADSSQIFGAGIANNGTITTLETCEINRNIIDPQTGGNTDTNLLGAGLMNERTINTIQYCVLRGNEILSPTSSDTTAMSGGGMFNYHRSTSPSIPFIQNSVIADNRLSKEPTSPGVFLIIGAGILSNGSLQIENTTISGNVLEQGGLRAGAGIYAEGDGNVNISNSTISGNREFGPGVRPAVVSEATITINLTNVTMFNNSSYDENGLFSGHLDVGDSGPVVTNNSLIGYAEDCTMLTGSNNLTADSTTAATCNTIFDGTFVPGTHISNSLADNGGPTFTHALLPTQDNPAWDAVASCGLTTDQRGFSRDSLCDVGAYELQQQKPIITPLTVWATCVDENLAVTISAGDGPFNITASAGINTPVNGVSIGTTTINGPEKWDNLTVKETSGDGQSVNLGQFKCRTDERPVPLTPAHRSRTTNPFPLFSWTAISGANNYRVFVFDDKVAANRTVDIRQNSGGPTSLTLSTPLPDGRLFWRVRGRQNRVWSLWSVRFTLFKDPVAPVTVNTPVPTVELEQPSGDEPAPTLVPTVGPAATFPAPPNSR